MSAHCENCGQPDPTTDNDGYTTCCNELVCYGDRRALWGNHDLGDTVTACCAATMVAEFERNGEHVPDIFWREPVR